MRGRIYGQVGIGATVHDGYRFTPDPFAAGISPTEARRRYHLYLTRVSFESRILFNPNASLGVRLNDRWSAELAWKYFSHRQIFRSSARKTLASTISAYGWCAPSDDRRVRQLVDGGSDQDPARTRSLIASRDPDEEVVNGERIRRLEIKVKRNRRTKPVWCGLKPPSGDPELDAAICAEAVACDGHRQRARRCKHA